MIFLRREETRLSGPSHSSLALRGRILCSGRKGAGGSSPKPQHSWDTVSHACCHVTPARSCRHHSKSIPDGSRMEQEPEAGPRPTNTPAGDQRQNRSTEKVERLRDNQRGLSVVIYNRDCKMVNQI